jgi:hypothetical protein
MADQKVFHGVRVDQPRDLYINGQLITAQAGTFMVTDSEGNLEIVDHSDFGERYASANDGVEGNVIEVKPNTRRAHKNEAEQELELVKPSGDELDPKKQQDLQQKAEVEPASKEETEKLAETDEAVTRVDAELSPEVPASKELSDKKLVVGEPSLKADDPAFPPEPTKPARHRGSKAAAEAPLSAEDLKGAK